MKENNFLNLLAAILTSTAAPERPVPGELRTKDNRSSLLVENLRRQLMKDNYDYTNEDVATSAALAADPRRGQQLEDTEKTPPAHVTRTTEIPAYSKHFVRSDANKTRAPTVRHRMFDNNSKYLIPVEDKKKLATAGREKAIYEYAEMKLRRRDYGLNPTEASRVQHTHRLNVDQDTNVTATYSLLKVNGHSRRSMQAPRLVKEEKPDEVSIVNLGEGPVPQFSLPSARRQYAAPASDLSYASDADERPALDADERPAVGAEDRPAPSLHVAVELDR
ncbi:uncharacterized protein [Battus philenor]|uniref:uncharacterized protein n=1 Tax=Battus philenor TaxID=42288 RepID=UPI0035D0F996